MRERDLPGHLPQEGPEVQRDARVMDAGAETDPDGAMVVRDVPYNPSSSPDPVLRIGYETLRAQMTR
jgi:hypothetical protein